MICFTPQGVIVINCKINYCVFEIATAFEKNSYMKKKILFLDDDPMTLYRYGTTFTDAGYEVQCIEVMEEVSSCVETFRPDLMILDIRMGSGDGRKICNELKSNPETFHIPIIMLTALSYNEISAVECDADAILGKSPNSENLLLNISNLLAK